LLGAAGSMSAMHPDSDPILQRSETTLCAKPGYQLQSA
jgi:hypothetical protein